jgi:hypothetical protein
MADSTNLSVMGRRNLGKKMISFNFSYSQQGLNERKKGYLVHGRSQYFSFQQKRSKLGTLLQTDANE